MECLTPNLKGWLLLSLLHMGWALSRTTC
ncbi:hypothetical protein OIU78_022719, partial [Salix suchowensis]